MRRLLLLALLCAACSNNDRAAPDSTNFQAAETHGPDPLLLRVPRAGGTGRVYVYPKLDSAVWTVDEAPSLLKFSEDQSHVYFAAQPANPAEEAAAQNAIQSGKAALEPCHSWGLDRCPGHIPVLLVLRCREE